MYDPVKGLVHGLLNPCVFGSGPAVLRRLIILICAGWLPHDKRFVEELPLSSFEGCAVSS